MQTLVDALPLPHVLRRLAKLDRAYPADEAELWPALVGRLEEEMELWSLTRQPDGTYTACCKPYDSPGTWGTRPVAQGDTPGHALAGAWLSRLELPRREEAEWRGTQPRTRKPRTRRARPAPLFDDVLAS